MSRQIIVSAAIAAALLIGTVARCEDKTPTLAEAKAAYEEADVDLNQAYQRARLMLRERDFKELKQKQRDWINYRDGCGEVIRRDWPELAKADLTQTLVYWKMMKDITRERTAILQSIVVSHNGKAPSLGGRWTDGVGGYLDIVEQDGRIAFCINVVRCPTHHTGGIVGFATVNGQLAHFDDGWETEGKDNFRKRAWLTFIRRQDHIELISANAGFYCGARAYFDGDYYRVGDLAEGTRHHVLESARRKVNPAK